jgi:uncharacterized protein with beta-barrel porin domain
MTVQITGNHQAVDLRAGDTLVVTAWNSVNGQTLAVRGRRRAVSGSLVDFDGSLLPTADRLASQLTIALDAGALVSVVVSTSIATQRGQTFVRLAIVDSAGNQRAILAQDYVTPGTALAWPGGRISSPTEGPGAIRSITGTDPAAGSDWSETVPTNARWRLITAHAILSASATVANRNVYLVIDDGTNILYIIYSGFGQTAGQSIRYQFVNSHWGGSNLGDTTLIPLPEIPLLRSGFRVRAISNMQTNDDWSAPQLLIEERIDV